VAGVNKVILVGRLGKDPDVRFAADGRSIVNCTLATSETWKDKQTGERREKTEWHRVVFFGGVAKIAGDYLKKGSQVYIEGKLTTEKWQDQSGQDRYTTKVAVDGFNGVMQMLDSRSGGTANYDAAAPSQGAAQNPMATPAAAPPPAAPASNSAPAMEAIDDFNDDIPF